MEQWRLLRPILDEALDTPNGQLSVFLDEACGEDLQLRRQAGALLQYDTADAEMLAPILDHAAINLLTRLGEAQHTGKRVGPYQLGQLIAIGGMGAVYHAERADGHFEQHVAIKIIRSDRASRQMRLRFERERQTLARLSHPNIARLLDGGVTDWNVPYLVMEHIDGVPINEFCDRMRATIPERLALFQVLCRAVHYAHQNLVIHCDLKPSNILVTASGELKVTDFGISRWSAEESGPDANSLSSSAVSPLTPRYSSPEQIQQGVISTASDFFSLGVLLFELLAGVLPGSGTSADSDRIDDDRRAAPSAELQKRMRDGVAADPIARSQVNQIAAARKLRPESMRRALRGDLDAIVMKAMQKSPEDRYDSAAQMDEDLSRHLAGHCVMSHPPTLTYRWGKLLRRHWIALGSAAAVIVMLVVALVLVQDSARVASDARDTARIEAGKSEATAEFLEEMLASANPDLAGRADIKVREILESATKSLPEKFAEEPLVRAALEQTIGRSYLRLGLAQESEVCLRRALQLRADATHSDRDKFASVMTDLASALVQLSRFDEAVDFYRQALQIRRDGPDSEALATTLAGLAGALTHEGRYDDAESAMREALEMHRKTLGEDDLKVARNLNNLAVVRTRQGALEEAENLTRQSLDIHKRLRPAESASVAESLDTLAAIRCMRGDSVEAESLYRKAIEVRRKRLGDTHPELAMSLTGLGRLLYESGRHEEAIRVLRDAIEIYRRLGGKDPAMPAALGNLAMTLMAEGLIDDAEPLLHEAYSLSCDRLGSAHPQSLLFKQNLALLLGLRGENETAERVYRELLDSCRESNPNDELRVAELNDGLGRVLAKGDRRNEAERCLRRALALREKHLPAGHLYVAASNRILGDYLMMQGKSSEAETRLRTALKSFQAMRPRPMNEIQAAANALAKCLDKIGQHEDARVVLESCAPGRGPSETP